jgi:hypothetical protein
MKTCKFFFKQIFKLCLLWFRYGAKSKTGTVTCQKSELEP